MDKKQLYENYEDFQSEHAEYDAAWQEFVEPIVLEEDDSIYGFVFGYLLV